MRLVGLHREDPSAPDTGVAELHRPEVAGTLEEALIRLQRVEDQRLGRAHLGLVDLRGVVGDLAGFAAAI